MARINVNPTRMELRSLKNRLKTAVRGHKMLKDKSDEMIRRFLILARRNKQLREEVEIELSVAMRSFMLAGAASDAATVAEAVSVPAFELKIKTEEQYVMNVAVPKLSVEPISADEAFPYGFASTPAELDVSVEKMSGVMNKLIELAEVEKSVNMLADEIEKNRRRVNALEYVMIPNIEETIKYITMKLDENERATTIRLMKFKDIVKEKE